MNGARFQELLDMDELSTRLRFKSGEVARKWARRQNSRGVLPLTKCGARWLVDWRDVSALLERDTRIALGGGR